MWSPVGPRVSSARDVRLHPTVAPLGVHVPALADGRDPRDGDRADLVGEVRIDGQLAVTYLETKHRADQQEGRTRGPGLRAAGGRIGHREPADGSRIAGERFWQSMA